MQTQNPTLDVIYCRVSGQKQVTQGSGLSSQETICREYAERSGYKVLMAFTDNLTGAIPKRPGMDAMLKYLKKDMKGQRVLVIIDDISRFARYLKLFLELNEQIKAIGCRLESPRMKFWDDPASEFAQEVLAAQAGFHLKINNLQTKGRMRARLLAGFWTFPVTAAYR